MVATTGGTEKSKPIAGNKVSKPLMEKKRRARINKCLDQLKSLLESYYSSNIRKRKLEKADILELTVKHLRNLQKTQSSAPDFSDYQFGFRGCLANVNQYLLTADSLDGRDRWMLSELSNKLRRSLGPGGASSTTDSGPGRTGTRDEAGRFLPSAAAPEQRKTARAKAPKAHSASASRCLASEDAQQSPGPKRSVPADSSTQTAPDRSSCNTRHCANIQHTVWRPW
uniref:Hairy-related 3 n=1 Tax=Mastacembelus armatus TaxID=205130 RepID=A0A3Q3SMR6_9TELE